MAERNISNSALRTALINGEPFEYAHLVKFERPFVPFKGKARTNANRYVYLTDGQRDLDYDGDTYNASGILTIGGYSETTQAKACLLYTSPSPRDGLLSRMPSSA